MQRFTILSFLILTMIVSNNNYVEARPYKNGNKTKGPMSQLDQEQRKELKQKLKSLRESGASPETISQTISEGFATAGIELPENVYQRINKRQQNWAERKNQKEEAHGLAKKMKNQGASREEIRNALKEAGIEKPRGKRQGPMSQLDQEQRREFRQKLKSLRESGASPEAISQAMTEGYTTAGIELPKNFYQRINKREQNWTERKNRKEEAHSLTKEMKAQGATRKEIRNALKEAGIEKPRGKRQEKTRRPSHGKQPNITREKGAFQDNSNKSDFITAPTLDANSKTSGIGTAVEADSWGRLKSRMAN